MNDYSANILLHQTYHSEASVTESPLPSSSEKPYVVYVLGPKSGVSKSSGSLIARIEKT